MLTSDINYAFPFATLSKLSSVILTPRYFPDFLIFGPFPGFLACFGQWGYTVCSPRAGPRWSASTSACDFTACVKSSGEAAKTRKFALLFATRARSAGVSLLEDCWNLMSKLCHMPLRTLRRNFNTSNFTAGIFSIFPAGYTRRAFIKLKNLGSIGCEN